MKYYLECVSHLPQHGYFCAHSIVCPHMQYRNEYATIDILKRLSLHNLAAKTCQCAPMRFVRGERWLPTLQAKDTSPGVQTLQAGPNPFD
ncbi:MAG: hypothetical protein ACYDEV_00335 [Acidiferrobacter sp.]